MSALTQKERIASLETHQTAHGREHGLAEQVWAGKLEAIEARLVGIERVLLSVRLSDLVPSGEHRRRLNRRDVGFIGGSAALTSIAWAFVDALRAAITA